MGPKNCDAAQKKVRRTIRCQDRALRLAWDRKPSGALLTGNSKRADSLDSASIWKPPWRFALFGPVFEVDK